MRARSFLPLACLSLLACNDSPQPSADESESATESESSGSESGTETGDGDGDGDAGDGDGDTSACDAVGIEPVPWDGSATAFAFDELIPDLAFETLRGPWSLSEAWDGCEVFVLVPYNAAIANTPATLLVEDSPPNVTYLFFSFSNDAASTEANVTQLASLVEDALSELPPDEAEEWTWRFRYITTPVPESPLFQSIQGTQTTFFGIDHHQRLRDAGSLSLYNGNFIDVLETARYAPRGYNYEARLEAKLEGDAALGDDVLIVPWLTTGVAELNEGIGTIPLPPAEDMARFDRAEIVIKEDCGRFPHDFDGCPAWDVGARFYFCPDESCDSDQQELFFRYITAYHAGGWWRHDITHALPDFKEGGDKWVYFNRNDFQGQVEFRFFDDGDDLEIPRENVVLRNLGGGPWEPIHNELMSDYSFTPPPGTTRVELRSHVSGHGNNSANGCAEFCTHSHEVDVNGQMFSKTFEMKNSHDCAARVDEGVVPNQFGTWFFDRGSWCPGWPVEIWQEDITEAVDLEGENTIRWRGRFGNEPWPPAGGSIAAQPWLVFYSDQDLAPAELSEHPLPACANPPQVTVRDFSMDHPDWNGVATAYDALPDGDPAKEAAQGPLYGVVADQLVDVGGGVFKPQFTWPEDTLPYTTAANFDQWWTDVPGVNHEISLDLPLFRSREGLGMYIIKDQNAYADAPLLDPAFGWGPEDAETYNARMTLEINDTFTYEAGQQLRLGVKGEMWVFIDHQLVYEGVDPMQNSKTYQLLELDSLGLTPGQQYEIHAFAAFKRRRNPLLWLEWPRCD